MLTVNSTINLAGQAVPNIIPAVQGDTGRVVVFTLADFTIPAGSTATYYVQKPSGEAVYNAATINDNKVTVELTAQSLAETGDNYGQVRILNGEDVVTSFDFILLVKPFRGIDAIESTTEMNIFDEAVEQAREEIAEAAEEAKEYISTAIDPTLTIEGKAADAKAAGDMIRAAFATDTASGSVASFSDGADGVPVKSLSVGIEAVQTGRGDPAPDNVRVISGWDMVKVARCRKNLIALEALSLPTSGHEIKDSNGKIISSSSSAYTHGYIGVKPGTKYTIIGRFTTSSSSAFLYVYDANRNWIQRQNIGAIPSDTSLTTFTTGPNTYYIQIQYVNTSSGADPTTWGLYEGETVADDTEQGQTYTIDLPQAVYGGTLDVSTGELVIDHALVDLGTLTWSKATGNNYCNFNAVVSDLDYNSTVPYVIADCYKSVAINAGATADGDNYIYSRSASATSNTISIKDTSKADMTIAEFKTAMNGHYAVYKMSTPTTMTLTPEQVTTLLGQNNIYADSGSVAVTYRADTGLYIDKRLNA